jgi:uncharacterized membrane protein YhaH (DUF805 family)
VRGEILTYDDGPGTGLISGDDGVRYAFTRADLQQLAPVRPGTKVDFVAVDGAATQVFVVGQAAAPGYTPGVAGSGATFDWRKLFLDANGRIGQKDYWIGFGIVFAAGLVFGWIPLIGFLFSLVAIYAGVCVSSKRLHDMGRSGWLAAIPYGAYAAATLLSVIFFMGAMGAAHYDNGMGFVAGMGTMGLLWTLAFVLNVGFVIWLGVTPGQPDDNAYGPPPQPLANF